MGEKSCVGRFRSAKAPPSSSSASESAPNVNMFSCRGMLISFLCRRGRLLCSTCDGSTWLDCPNEAVEKGRDELVLVTGLKTDSDPPPLGVNMN
jgi:hypothetical protein